MPIEPEFCCISCGDTVDEYDGLCEPCITDIVEALDDHETNPDIHPKEKTNGRP